jgi:hypothetical protein
MNHIMLYTLSIECSHWRMLENGGGGRGQVSTTMCNGQNIKSFTSENDGPNASRIQEHMVRSKNVSVIVGRTVKKVTHGDKVECQISKILKPTICTL